MAVEGKGVAKPKTIFSDTEQKLIVALYRSGKTDQEIADILGRQRQTFLKQVDYNKLKTKVSQAKAEANEKVVDSVINAACGYEYKETRDEYAATQDGKTGRLVSKTVTTKHQPANMTAAIFFLKNRDPENWKDKQEIGLSSLEPVKVEWAKPDANS